MGKQAKFRVYTLIISTYSNSTVNHAKLPAYSLPAFSQK